MNPTRVSWEIPYAESEIRHQLEPGEARPMHINQGVAIAIVDRRTEYRHGPNESVVMAVVIHNGRFIELPIADLTHVPEPSNERRDPIQVAEGIRAEPTAAGHGDPLHHHG